MYGKRGCALGLAFVLHVLGFAALLAGFLTPFWTRIEDASGMVTVYSGLLVDYNKNTRVFTLRDFNNLTTGSTDGTQINGGTYITLAVLFGFLAVFMEFFVLQAFSFALYNQSCGNKYLPEWLIFFSILSGILGITCLALYQQHIAKALMDTNIGYDMDYSRGFVIFFIAAVCLAAFFTICDRRSTSVGGKH